MLSNTSTPTPFQPIPPTATRLPSLTPIPTSTPTLVPTVIPSPVPTDIPTVKPWYLDLDLPHDQQSFLVLGSDLRPDGGFRTDIILLVILNPDQGTASLVSFPRDLWVYIPYWGMNRLNTAMQYGGFNTLVETMDYNFGIRPQHYLMTNFQGFTGIVDSLDGIDVYVHQELRDSCDLPIAQGGLCYMDIGVVPMDGETALWYVRSRKSTSDFERTRRSQEVVQAFFERLISLNGITRIPELYQIVSENIETDLTLEQLLPLVQLVPELQKPGSIRNFYIGQNEVWDYVDPYSGAMVLIPNQTAIWNILQQATNY